MVYVLCEFKEFRFPISRSLSLLHLCHSKSAAAAAAVTDSSAPRKVIRGRRRPPGVYDIWVVKVVRRGGAEGRYRDFSGFTQREGSW